MVPYKIAMLGYAAACQNHPQREAMGICVRCRARICGECVTRIDGINHCVTCVASFAKADATLSRSAPLSPGLSWALASGLVVLVTVLVWGLLEVAFPGS